jgi:hypothetical protein
LADRSNVQRRNGGQGNVRWQKRKGGLLLGATCKREEDRNVQVRIGLSLGRATFKRGEDTGVSGQHSKEGHEEREREREREREKERERESIQDH